MEIYDFFKRVSRGTEYQDYAWGTPEMVISRFAAKEVPKKVAWADATRSQSARIISDWFFINNQPDFARQTLSLAETGDPLLRNAPEFCAALGLSEMRFGNKIEALALLEKAASTNIQRPEIYRSLSQLRLENLMALHGENYKPDAQEWRDIIKPLYAAIKLSPANPQSYLQLMKIMQHINEPLPKEFWETLVNNCCAQFPDNFELLDQLVPILLKNGLQGGATRLLDATAKCVLTTDEQRQLGQLKAMVGGHN